MKSEEVIYHKEHASMKNFVNIIMITLVMLFCTAVVADEGTSTSSTVTKTSNANNPNSTTTQSTTVTTTTVNDADAGISSAIYAKYAKDSALIGTDISVNSVNGVVTLNGSVTAQSQADEAVEVAKAIAGVKDVRSSIIVTTNSKTVPSNKITNY